MFKKLLKADSSPAIILIRLMVGGVFLSEGIQKIIFPAAQGAGRFAQIGLPNPDFFGPFVGFTEIICGTLLLIGLATRIVAIPLLAVITTAICTTKIPMLIHKGFWAAAHEARTDACMFLGLIFLICLGAGKWSVDNKLSQEKR